MFAANAVDFRDERNHDTLNLTLISMADGWHY